MLRKVHCQRPMCYVTKAIPDDLQQPMAYNAHTYYNLIWFTPLIHISTPMAYDLQFELKAKVGRVKQEQAQHSTHAAVNIRQGIGHSSLKNIRKNKIKMASFHLL